MIKTAVALISIHEGRWLVFVTLTANMQEARDIVKTDSGTLLDLVTGAV